MNLSFSIIVPVYDRPFELDELLDGLIAQTYEKPFEVIIVDDGSTDDCQEVAEGCGSYLDIHYYFKENSGPGLTRNYGMERAKGNYFIIFDSDCLIPKDYLKIVDERLSANYTDFYGGPDAASPDFTVVQKAINFSMTSFITTGGIRGKKNAVGKFQPRSFNLGMSRKAFELTGGFSKMRVGEDIDFSFRAKDLGLKSQLISEAFVYHKRRTNYYDFLQQTKAFGRARPLLNRKYKGTAKITYWFPSFLIITYFVSLIAAWYRFPWIILGLMFYLFLIFVVSSIQNRSLNVGLHSIVASMIQFYGYGSGFLRGLFDKDKKD